MIKKPCNVKVSTDTHILEKNTHTPESCYNSIWKCKQNQNFASKLPFFFHLSLPEYSFRQNHEDTSIKTFFRSLLFTELFAIIN